MSREIKFRAWDKIYNEWFTQGFSVCESGKQIFDANEFAFNVGEHIELMQYTGLHDKNGKEIYEGDILQTVGDNGERLSKFKIYYDNDGACFMKASEDGEYYKIDSSQKCLEVIGNIYETPELITK